MADYTLRKFPSAINCYGIIAVTGRAHCQRQVAFFENSCDFYIEFHWLFVAFVHGCTEAIFFQLRTAERENRELLEQNTHLEEKLESTELQNSSSVFNHSANSLFSELSASQHLSHSTDSMDLTTSHVSQQASQPSYHNPVSIRMSSLKAVTERPDWSFTQLALSI